MRTLTGLLAAAVSAAPSVVFAHEGEHAGSFITGFAHVLTEPDHLAAVLGLATLLGGVSVVRRIILKRRNARRRSAAQTQE